MPQGTRAYQEIASQARKDELILRHLPLVRHVLGRILVRLPAGIDLENLEAAGVLGLVEAAGKFDPDRGARFETYASVRIRGAVLDEMRRNCPLPQDMLGQIGRLRKAYEDLPAGAQADELASAAGLTIDEVADCLAAMRFGRVGYATGNLEPLKNHPAPEKDRPDLQAELDEQRDVLAGAIEALPAQERQVLVLYYREGLRLREIGEAMHLSESRVCRLLNLALYDAAEHVRAREAI